MDTIAWWAWKTSFYQRHETLVKGRLGSTFTYCFAVRPSKGWDIMISAHFARITRPATTPAFWHIRTTSMFVIDIAILIIRTRVVICACPRHDPFQFTWVLTRSTNWYTFIKGKLGKKIPVLIKTWQNDKFLKIWYGRFLEMPQRHAKDIFYTWGHIHVKMPQNRTYLFSVLFPF